MQNSLVVAVAALASKDVATAGQARDELSIVGSSTDLTIWSTSPERFAQEHEKESEAQNADCEVS